MTKEHRLSNRALAYGIPGETVDGNDVFAVYEAASKAVERARRGEGPTLLECLTYRWQGHTVGDPVSYTHLPYRMKQALPQYQNRFPQGARPLSQQLSVG